MASSCKRPGPHARQSNAKKYKESDILERIANSLEKPIDIPLKATQPDDEEAIWFISQRRNLTQIGTFWGSKF